MSWQLSNRDDSSDQVVRLRAQKAKSLRQKIDEAFEKWEDYKEMFDKNYSEDQEADYMEAFVKNVIHIEDHNREHRLGRKTFEMGLNHIADLDMKCHFKKKDVGADDKGFVDLPEGDEHALKVNFHISFELKIYYYFLVGAQDGERKDTYELLAIAITNVELLLRLAIRWFDCHMILICLTGSLFLWIWYCLCIY
uniref:Inhibitor_I29 domain-containing protein n=1 Tax=Heterorhabditis bacteriophora TaxID=37862 RepID=A0A1I7XP33_HETBA